ncbi:MAG: ABC transporter ATP-binding protein [Bacteriovorax sp.]|nr:ABC transporter ATP-binding protein [Bacteriovorax sp.]
MESLKITDLTFHFDSKIIFNQFSLELELGKMYALVGPSGVGKSTFAHLIAGHLIPDSGEIYLGNKKIEKPLRDIFIVHQEDDLFPWQTVMEQLEFVGASDEMIESLLRIFKLLDSKNLYPNELSGGMKKRLALIRAELVGARILILDETLNSLNRTLLQDILNEMVPRWREQKITVIFITHHLDEIKDYIDQVITF